MRWGSSVIARAAVQPLSPREHVHGGEAVVEGLVLDVTCQWRGRPPFCKRVPLRRVEISPGHPRLVGVDAPTVGCIPVVHDVDERIPASLTNQTGVVVHGSGWMDDDQRLPSVVMGNRCRTADRGHQPPPVAPLLAAMLSDASVVERNNPEDSLVCLSSCRNPLPAHTQRRGLS